MKKEKNIHKKTESDIPEGYFEQFEDRLQAQIKLDTILGMNRKSGFSVPDGYFDTFPEIVATNLRQELSQEQRQPKVISLFQKSTWLKLSGIAAAVLLGVFILYSLQPEDSLEDLDLATIETYVSEVEDTFSEYELIEALSENSANTLNVDAFEEEQLLEYLEDTLDEYDMLTQ